MRPWPSPVGLLDQVCGAGFHLGVACGGPLGVADAGRPGSGIELRRGNPSEYLRHNLYITTSGVCSPAPLICALLALGPEHILFGTDYPFEEMDVATKFLRDAPISEADRAKIAHGNAERLLRL